MDEHVKGIRDRLTGLMGRVRKEFSACRLGPVGKSFEDSGAALGCEDYEVVVCGEVKRGKSSLINALLGQDILPVGVKETTSQVFRITHAKRESFALVFEDGHREAISREELGRYGSQSVTDLEGHPMFKGRVLKWIEVNVPAAWLPAGVHVVDTPGLGALYAEHTAITSRFIEQADAVIFVLDSDQPLVASEKQFLDKVYKITPNVMFVQTKIDTRSTEEWEAVKARSEEMLRAPYASDGRVPPVVLPMSSKLLFEASRSDNEEEKRYLLEDSGFEAVRERLQWLIFRAAGWSRCAWAAAESARCVEGAIASLNEQRTMLAAKSGEDKEALKKNRLALHSQFQREWDSGGSIRGEFRREVEKILNAMRQESFNITGTIRSRVVSDIDGIGSREALKEYVRRLPSHLQREIESEWRALIGSAQDQLRRLSSGFAMSGVVERGVDLELPHIQLKDPSIWARVKTVNIDAMIGGGLAAIVAGLFLTGGLGAIAVIAGGLFGAIKGGVDVATMQLEQSKNELKNKLPDMLEECRKKLCSPDIKHGRSISVVDELVEDIRSQVEAGIQTRYLEQKTQMEEESRRMEDQSLLEGRQREEALATVDVQMKRWAGLKAEALACVSELKQMQKALDLG